MVEDWFWLRIGFALGLGYESQRTARSNPGAPPTSDLYHAPPPFKEAEKSGDNFARGGNGIFGEPMVSGIPINVMCSV